MARNTNYNPITMTSYMQDAVRSTTYSIEFKMIAGETSFEEMVERRLNFLYII